MKTLQKLNTTTGGTLCIFEPYGLTIALECRLPDGVEVDEYTFDDPELIHQLVTTYYLNERDDRNESKYITITFDDPEINKR